MWGGGNCSNVCEAWATVVFNKSGGVVSIKGVSLNEVRKLLKNN